MICAKVLSLTLQLSRQFQNPTADSVQAIAHIDEVEATVAQMGESGYPKVFQIAERLCQQMSLRLDMPLLIARQSRPNDVAAFTREEYVRLLVLLSFLDHFRTQLSKRTTQLLSALLLQNIAEAEKDLNMERINTLCAAFISLNELSGEVLTWTQKWKNSTPQRFPAVHAVSLCPKVLYPNVHCLLQILAIMPVSTVEAARSFSTLRRPTLELQSVC